MLIVRNKILLSFILCPILWLVYYSFQVENYIWCQKVAFALGLFVSVHMVFETILKKNKSLFLFSLFLLLYLLIVYYQIFLDIPITIRYDFYNPQIFTKVLLIHILFLFSLWLFWRPEYKGELSIKVYDNSVIWWVNILICTFIFFGGQKGESILDGGYGSDLQTSSLNDYIVIFFIYCL